MFPYSFFKRLTTQLPLLVLVLFLLSPSLLLASELAEVSLKNDDILLLDTYLNDKPLHSALDTYLVDGKLMLAVEPLFDSLTLRYVREKKLLRLWKKEQYLDFSLLKQAKEGNWADDGFYLYIDEKTFSQLFDVTLHYNTANLTLRITSDNFQFPVQKLAELAQQRQLEQLATSLEFQKISSENLLADQYRLFTIPHGSFSFNTRLQKDKESSFNYSIQTASDFLYHSASLTVTDVKSGDATGRLNFSRYKTLPDKLIAGTFDKYSFGDINTISDNLTNSTQSGLGFIFSRSPEQYQTRNVGTTITETARPGWDAELYRNGQFIEVKKVPLDGNLIFEDVETRYGSNRYEIKLYGPFGEQEVRNQYLVLDKNSLAKGEMAYSFYGLDGDMNLINNQGDDDFSLDNSGASFNYGITDNWLMGINYVVSENLSMQKQQLMTLKNAFAFPGLLFNNEISLQKDHGYAQISSLSGNAFAEDTFNLIYESSDDYQSNRVQSAGISRQYVDFSYSGTPAPWNYTLGLAYTDFNDNQSWLARNTLSRTIAGINFSNNIFYRRNVFANTRNESTSNDSVLGTFVAAGALTDAIRISSTLDYQLKNNQEIRSAAVSLSWNDRLNLYHNLRGVYQLKSSVNPWQLNYNLSWNSEQFQIQLAADYDAQSNWSVGFGIRFFLGYDHQNQKIIISNQLASNTATLNSHSYLDRNPNGWRDEGDWDLAGVTYSGNPAWENLTSGDSGRTVLPGVIPNAPFKFNAKWEYGTKARANSFVLYTHPGAYLDVNMPFYVTTDFSGFIFKINFYQEQSPLTGVQLELVNNNNVLIAHTTTDIDGYYQFLDIIPGSYSIRVSSQYLTESGYTASTVGYHINTVDRGGILELPPLTLKKLPLNQQKSAQRLRALNVKNLNPQTNIWLETDNPNYGKIYSHAASGNYKTQQFSSEPDGLPESPPVRDILPNQPVTRANLPIDPIVRENSPVQPVVKTAAVINLPTPPTPPAPSIIKKNMAELPVASNIQTITRTILPNAPIVRDRLPVRPITRTALPVVPVTRTQNSTSIPQQTVSKVQNDLNQLNVEPSNTNKSVTNKSEPNKGQTNKGYRLQLIAGLNKSMILASANSFTQFGAIYFAEKQIKGETWYCLLSQEFSNEKSARQVLMKSGASVWLVKSELFSRIVAVNKIQH